MDEGVVQKIINHYGEPCPSFKFENPLLDKNVAKLLSKGFMKLLNHSKSSDSHRLSVLKNIRKSCRVEPPEHLYVNDNVTELLRNAYMTLSNNYHIEKDLDSFLLRSLKEMNIPSVHCPSLKLDIIQALFNLNGNKQDIHDILLKDVIHWNIDDSNQNSYMAILESMWDAHSLNRFNKNHPDDVSVKMKPKIEKILLPHILEMLSVVILEEDQHEWFDEQSDLKKLNIMCSISCECFQICCSIMNNIFTKTNFDKQLQQFIALFIDCVKLEVEYLSKLYPCNIQPLVVLLDIELDSLEGETKAIYIKSTLEKLQSLYNECPSDVIMLLSHFNQWFPHYYKYNN